MIINTSEISKVFDQLLKESISREEAADWAYTLQNAYDNNDLEFSPNFDKDKILKSIFFLTGVDLKDTPKTYLHILSDIENFRRQNGI